MDYICISLTVYVFEIVLMVIWWHVLKFKEYFPSSIMCVFSVLFMWQKWWLFL